MKGSRRGFVATSVGGGLALAAGSAEAQSESSKVDRRKFGLTGADVSIYGLGLGSAFFKPLGDKPDEAARMLERALGLGINYWDTAASYQNSEELIGPVLEKHRKEVFMVSKSGAKTYDDFMKEFESSLKNLRTDYIDLYHMHNWQPKKGDTSPKAREGAFKAITKLKDEGVIRNFGVTGHSGADILIQCVKAFNPDALLTTLPANRPDDGKYEDELLPLCAERNMGVIAMKTVKHVKNSDQQPRDLIRYALSLPGVSTAIVGTGDIDHLESNAKLATGFKPFKGDELKAFADKVAFNIPTGLPQPWDLPGYEDGMLA